MVNAARPESLTPSQLLHTLQLLTACGAVSSKGPSWAVPARTNTLYQMYQQEVLHTPTRICQELVNMCPNEPICSKWSNEYAMYSAVDSLCLFSTLENVKLIVHSKWHYDWTLATNRRRSWYNAAHIHHMHQSNSKKHTLPPKAFSFHPMLSCALHPWLFYILPHGLRQKGQETSNTLSLRLSSVLRMVVWRTTAFPIRICREDWYQIDPRLVRSVVDKVKHQTKWDAT